MLAEPGQKREATARRPHQIPRVKDRARIAEYLSKEGQALLPLVDFVEEAHLA